MYVWIFRHLSGPKWLKVLESAASTALIVWALFTYVYLWTQLLFDLGGVDL